MNGHGGARCGSGRHSVKGTEKKSVQIAFRVTEEQKRIICEKAKSKKMSLSEYMLFVAIQK